ncbi:DNA repair protein RadA [Candidatus Falkowbacteria bacterium CG10_big_fil_rev_8_21_14_0_10_43_10]|uniref:DNA repair protein RadA n=1 Tax=Candidatus Falkowbacteria bacterium CG10_big_fil_rev_8_21_14_0_10_43_10 TaxID=1974567 RepID=A0A2H0V1B7_9BACT|nr:MAG: DNA repair protein RadA [Candidatus Falkowbacteria bacterium CG10_big_fil_rev_8_21_14_0_10_43_10]
MPKLTTIYSCSNCGAQSPKWSGRCLSCGAWGTLQEEIIDSGKTDSKTNLQISPAKITYLNSIALEKLQRLPTGIAEFDRVLGGGIVPGSLVLIGGEPGIGKSTLMLQLAASLTPTLSRKAGEGALYISGEESATQIKSRLARLQINSNLQFSSETNVEKIISAILATKPPLVIIDSIQTAYSSEVPAETGSVNQIRACAAKLLQVAKENNITIFITGHITKDGLLAGPKTLEHLVDTVIYLEQQKNKDFRILRTVKNRFGGTDEIGLFEMTGAGFKEIINPSSVFLDERANAQTGNVISCVMEGTRPFLVETQALATKTVFGYPQRKSAGFDLNRLQILIAVLTKRAGVNLMAQDVHINIVGGLKITETALDLAVCAAIISSLLNQTIDSKTIILGEVGLGGEVRNVYKLEQRLNEAAKLGFTKAIVPAYAQSATASKPDSIENLNLIKVKNIVELVKYITTI